jgi:Ni,Fe-hydrogenase III large subunit
MADFIPLANGVAIPRRELPLLDFPQFRQDLLDLTKSGANVVQFFGYQEADRVRVLAVMRKGYKLLAAEAIAPDVYPALTADDWKFNCFERELAEQFGILPQGHPWFKPLRYHTNWRGVSDAFGADYHIPTPGHYEYFQVSGEQVHEVGVGPVHAGIIEPGHFRFQCVGEKVLHLEIQLGYQHRGVERLLASLPFKRLPIVVEGIAGDTAIGNSLCFAQAIESLGRLEVTDAARTVRTIALELERLACHVGDLGAMSGDIAFSPPAAYYGRLRGEFLNLLLVLSGNRFGKGLIRPGGVTRLPIPANVELLAAKIAEVRPEIIQVADLLFTAHSVRARFEGCGCVDRQTAAAIGLVGVAGRASGLDYDAREYFPTEKYTMMPPCSYNPKRGEVYSRAEVRYEEICHSLNLVEKLLATLSEKELAYPYSNWRLVPDSLVVTINEPWRGELSHCLLTDENGRIRRYKVKDASFHNWPGLALALRDQEISDFPLNNKSFNLSYCGFDL